MRVGYHTLSERSSMRKPNGYGAVLKLSGNRRKPYAVRITTGWTEEGKQITKYIGYYTTRKNAEIALAEYNRNPYVIQEELTLSELFDRYMEFKEKTLARKTLSLYRTAWNTLGDISTVKVSKLNLGLLQRHFDLSDKNKPILQSCKTLLLGMFDYAIKNELLPPERKAIVSNIDLSAKENPNAIQRSIFTAEEIDRLWNTDSDMSRAVLTLIYTGLRISELLELKEENVHLSEQYIEVVASKTKAGIRTVPIADKILPFFKTYDVQYPAFHYRWDVFMKSLGMEHTPHDTRHTCISLLASQEVDQRIIKAIVGHSGSGVTEAVYTHIPLYKLLDAINMI